ncbi:NADH-dependent flavin oxidoreductase [Paenibacillus sp. UNC451MF]|uniref:NADH-dependent flavin oxidoreductase n=1 Tax=Paenibacillus sp. UNC451MF TaxID=1449063 RepID=UPI0004916DBA|nr:NADH-dependent flavin oxidoreductase [Paenibacillus sp. UNC451MF]
MNPNYKPLLQSYSFRSGVHLSNRIVMAPMTNWSSKPDGSVSDEEVQYYGRRSGQVGLVVTACAYVTPNGKGFHGEFGADRDEMIPSLQRLAAAIKAKGSKAVLQIFHGGRECPPELVPGGEVVSAGSVPSPNNPSLTPRALSNEEITSIIKDFGDATRRAIEAGYDGVEIHGANGYLIQQFFSPHSNTRDDQWGGNLVKRMTFPLAIVDEVKRVVAEHARDAFLIGYRFSPEEAETPGITMADTLELVEALSTKELDYIHVSLMDFWSKPRTGDELDRPRIELIKEKAADRVPVIGVGAIHSPEEALKAFETGIPLIALGRELIMDPDWVKKVEEGNESEINVTVEKDAQERLMIPDPLWNAIINTPGWFPVV